MRRNFCLILLLFVLIIDISTGCGLLFGPAENPGEKRPKNPEEKTYPQSAPDQPAEAEPRRPVEKTPEEAETPIIPEAEAEQPARSPRKWPDQHKTSTESMCQGVLGIDFPAPLPAISELKDRFLNAHNDIRRRYKQKELVWDDNLAAYAQRWANRLKTDRKCRMQHRQKAGVTEGKLYGENLAWNWRNQSFAEGKFDNSPESAVYGWSRECADYDYETNKCKPNEQCGHFTQVIWHDVERVGCGVAVCRDETGSSGNFGHAEVWVCNYDPPGNWIGKKPY